MNVLRLTTQVPSRQPILFYRFLLAGQKVEARAGHAAYIVLWKALTQAGKAPQLALEAPSDEEVPQPIEDDGDDDVMLVPRAKPPSRKRRKTDFHLWEKVKGRAERLLRRRRLLPCRLLVRRLSPRPLFRRLLLRRSMGSAQ